MSVSELRKAIRATEIKLNNLKYDLQEALEEQERVEVESNDQRAWLAEFTARQAHYHSR